MDTVKIEIEGTYRVHDGMITVTAPWGKRCATKNPRHSDHSRQRKLPTS